jgi:hypothetical protein
MKLVLRSVPCLSLALPLLASLFCAVPQLAATPVTLQRVIELALSHSTTSAAASADEQRVYASYLEARDSYLPQMVLDRKSVV